MQLLRALAAIMGTPRVLRAHLQVRGQLQECSVTGSQGLTRHPQTRRRRAAAAVSGAGAQHLRLYLRSRRQSSDDVPSPLPAWLHRLPAQVEPGGCARTVRGADLVRMRSSHQCIQSLGATAGRMRDGGRICIHAS